MSFVEHDLVGGSPALTKVVEFIAGAARSKSSVLLLGESGTGKELVARAIHRNSARSGGPYIALNCAALNEDTLQNELFGHEKEAFTGAVSRRKGMFELADGGTLFLDEIGEISRRVQAALLRAVECGEVQKLGGCNPSRVDIRLITATNRNLAEAVDAGEFRLDLWCRLKILAVEMPPLRERREDIPALARHFVSMVAAENQRRMKGISSEAESILVNHDWRGNVRELKHVIEEAIAFASGEIIETHDLPASVRPKENAAPVTLRDVMLQAKRDFVRKAVINMKGDAQKIAQVLGIHPAGLARLLDGLRLSELKKACSGRGF